MGHASISITSDIYTHLFRGDEDAVAVEALTAPPEAQATNVRLLDREAN
jgi:hypothetical protein